MSHLFIPIPLRDLTLRNRVWVAPMCQYSAELGVPNDWHLVHLGSFARGGAGLVISEAAAVSPDGRISPGDAGIWNGEQQQAWTRIVEFLHGQGAAAGIQLAHAGRKGSTRAPFEGHGQVPPVEGGWETVGPTAVAYQGLPTPRALSTGDIDRVVDDFAQAARRSVAAGFDLVELHAAHGYLLHQFLSPLSNLREDEYGGAFDNRVRLVLRVVDAVRAVVPDTMPLLVRVSATDWMEGGWSVDDSVALARQLKEAGVDLVDVSSGGNAPRRSRSGRATRCRSPAGSARRPASPRVRSGSSPSPNRPRTSSPRDPRTSYFWHVSCCATRTGHCGPPTSSACRPARGSTGRSSTCVPRVDETGGMVRDVLGMSTPMREDESLLLLACPTLPCGGA
jgi:2,4-dienoyl-CoA reductase-like NADH-dependent reductase (Old Yellow Enzyme family)